MAAPQQEQHLKHTNTAQHSTTIVIVDLEDDELMTQEHSQRG